MSARRPLRTLLAAALALGAMAGATAIVPTAARAEPAAPWFEQVASSSVNVSGTYEPIVGNFTDLALDDIVWYAPGTAADQWWTPCPGCAGGPFTKKALVPQVSGRYEPVVGDFSGDGHDDIYWWGGKGGADHLWTSNGSAGFTSQRLDVADRYGSPLVLPDSEVGDGKDAILWSGAEQTQDGRLWEFAANGSGRVVRSAPLGTGGDDTVPLVGDFDGSGATDVLWYARQLGPCIPSCAGPAARADLLLSRLPGGLGFLGTPGSVQVKGWFAPVAGSLGASDDAKADILWIGAEQQGRVYPIDGPDALWEGAGEATFAKRAASIPFPASGQVLHHAGADVVLVRQGYPSEARWIWFDATGGPVLREAGTDLAVGLRGAIEITGRFTDADADAIMAYLPGAGRERLFAQAQ